MNRKIIAGNWKMNTSLEEARQLSKTIKENIPTTTNTEIILFPPFIYLSAVANELKGSRIKLGAQNIFPDNEGAFTGEISPKMIKDFCEFTIVGHSERRSLFKESNHFINQKIIASLENNLKVILCVGETFEQKNNGLTTQTLTNQIEESLMEIHDFKNITIAYEPVWAIGTGISATPDDCRAGIEIVRRALKNISDSTSADSMPILYGGSMNSKNTTSLLTQNGVNGGLIGGASLKAQDFIDIIKQAEKIK
jgi:triosephosphate isomerase